MPIKSLEFFLFENKLVSTSSLEILQNATIGIDVEHYLSRIYTLKKEQLLSGIGGVPSTLKQYIQSDVNVFKESNIRPLFVLPGLRINNSQKKYQTNELSPSEQHLDATWFRLHSKQANYNGYHFGFTGDSFRFNIDPLPISPMMNDLVKVFIECGVDYIISPYDASFQLSYLYRSGVIDCIYGSTDLLLTSIDKFILGMEFPSKDFRFVDKQRVLSELNLTERQLIDLSIMVGCSAQPETFSNFFPLPKVSPLSPLPQMNYFRMAMDIFFQCATINGPPADLLGYVKSLNDQSLLNLYYNGHAAIKFMPIMNTDGYVELFSAEMSKLGYEVHDDLFKIDQQSKVVIGKETVEHGTVSVPTELHSVLSQRLPHEIYFYHSLGLLPSKLLEGITSGEYMIRPPLASGGGETYKKLIGSKKLQKIMDFQFNMITQLLARYYQVKKINVVYWFQKEPVPLNNRLEPPISTRLRDTNPGELSQASSDSVWSTFRASTPKSSNLSPSEEQKILGTSFQRALFLMQVLDERGNLNGVGRMMKVFCEQNPDVEDKTLEDLFLLLLFFASEGAELVSSEENFGKSFKGSKDDFSVVKLSSEELSQLFLVSRIFATQKFNIHPINYQGPISRSLLIFRSHLKVFQETAQNSFLVSFIDLIVRDGEFKSTNLAKEKWRGLIDCVPFYKDLNNTLLGVVSEIFFGTCLKNSKIGKSNDQCINASKDFLLNFVFQVGKPSHNMNLNSANSVTPEQFDRDLAGGVKFWNHFKSLLKISEQVDPSFLSSSDRELFEKADGLVRSFF